MGKKKGKGQKKDGAETSSSSQSTSSSGPPQTTSQQSQPAQAPIQHSQSSEGQQKPGKQGRQKQGKNPQNVPQGPPSEPMPQTQQQQQQQVQQVPQGRQQTAWRQPQGQQQQGPQPSSQQTTWVQPQRQPAQQVPERPQPLSSQTAWRQPQVQQQRHDLPQSGPPQAQQQHFQQPGPPRGQQQHFHQPGPPQGQQQHFQQPGPPQQGLPHQQQTTPRQAWPQRQPQGPAYVSPPPGITPSQMLPQGGTHLVSPPPGMLPTEKESQVTPGEPQTVERKGGKKAKQTQQHKQVGSFEQTQVPQQQVQSKEISQVPVQQQKTRGPQTQQKTQAKSTSSPTDTLTKQVGKMTITKGSELAPMKFAKYPTGTIGRRIPVETNHFPLLLGKLQTAYHYDVNIIPDTPKKYLRTVMDLFRQKTYPKRWPAFDGRKNLYSSSLLPFGDSVSGDVILRENDGREKSYKVEVKFANEVDLRPLTNLELSKDTPREALQVVDIVLRSAPAVNLVPVGRSFFSKPATIIQLGEGMEMYNGIYQSAIRGWKPFLNVDVAHKAFPKSMNLIEALVEVLSTYNYPFQRDNLQKYLRSDDLRTFEKFIKTLRVVYLIPNTPSSRRVFRVNGLKESADKAAFTLDNGQRTTVDKYFESQKRYRLRYPAMPTVWVGDVNRKSPILIPMELCTLEEGQVVNRKMTENQTSAMIRHAATDTNTRKNKIRTGVESANYNTHPSVKEFGFSVSNVFERLDARVLTPPQLNYNTNRPISVSKGVWRADRFFAGAEINSWTIVSADRRAPRNEDFAKLEDMLYRGAQQNGIQISNRAQKPFINIGATAQEIKKYFQSKKGQFDVIFVIVPPSGPQYSYVKSAAEINTGCLTQCIKTKTLFKMNPQTAGNILLKVNAKLNGTNHCLQNRPPIMNRPTMIMGADVTHPSPEATHIPSVAAVTASHDPKAFKYNICWRLQPPKQEIIDDLENITVEHLKYFFEKTRVKPEKIVFFRDGVSEGQFDIVRRAEITAIRAACKKLQSDGYEPAITFLVVQKRHHTRLFPVNPRDSEDRNFNVPAGTCVDHTITHPFMQDFYLVSHASIQGVAKPTKYCTLWDDNDLSNDDIEELTYFLCHMFSRCNRSVSYPAPTYYAHLAAARAKVYIENDRLDLNDLRREYQKYLIQDEIRKGKPMFFV